jgi:hypothetical protein
VVKIPNAAWLKNLGASYINHCVIFAKLVIDKKDYGNHAFVVKLREVAKAGVFKDEEIKLPSLKQIRIPR